jgi:hypothetical protein
MSSLVRFDNKKYFFYELEKRLLAYYNARDVVGYIVFHGRRNNFLMH